MDSRTIRTLYLNYFKNKEHTVVPSIGLVPFDDPTILFTSAGMVQFKKLWATSVTPPYTRAVTCQKCMRAGGKDSDIDKIGVTGRHHTFFEMLGNFSFGDYFKKETIEWAFEFVTAHLKINEGVLWVSYYEEDRETLDIWKKILPSERIVPLSKKDNFWGPAGDTGPCGPCTELYIDFGKEASCSSDCKPGCECNRFLEFWNLVFPQYDKQKDGSLLPLKRRGVDTGMGLERISRILQKTPSNYETDLFLPIIQEIENISGHSYEKKQDKKSLFRITADHIRAAVFLIDDNIFPSNEGRGYVLRRILRRAGITGLGLGIKGTFLNRLSRVPVAIMQDVYPSLKEHAKLIERVIYEEEEKFHILLDSASKNFQDLTSEIEGGFIPGEVAFKLYDTYGIPKDLLEDLSSQENRIIDWEGFDRQLEEQKRLSRFSTSAGMQKTVIFERTPLTETVFTGYFRIEDEGNVTAVYRDDRKGFLYVVLDRTPFYPEKGGQVGDRGVLESKGMRFKVTDTQVDEKGIIYHIGRMEKGNLEEGIKVSAVVDGEFRKRVSINHTATHLLHYALKQILGKDIRQAGSYVGDGRLRFDFVCFSSLSDDTTDKVESLIQDKIIENSPVSVEEMSLDQAIERGAIALFLEKYGEKVRVIHLGDYHSEVCGGTHTDRTGSMLLFRITGISSIGKNLKRIEAVTYKEAVKLLKCYKKIVDELALKLEVEGSKVQQKVEKLLAEREEKDRMLEKYEGILASYLSREVTGKKETYEVDGLMCNLATGIFAVENNDIMSRVSDEVMSIIKEGIVFLGNRVGGKIFVVIKVSENFKEKFPAVNLMKEVSGILSGQGGGSPVFARGSGKGPENFERAVERVREIIKQ